MAKIQLVVEIEERLYKNIIDNDKDDEEFEAMDVAFNNAKPLPKGHNENNDYAECDQFVCSECGIELQDWHRVERDIDDGDISYHEYTFRYCPNCGAIIEAEEG